MSLFYPGTVIYPTLALIEIYGNFLLAIFKRLYLELGKDWRRWPGP